MQRPAIVMLAAAFLVLFVGGGSRFAIGLTLKAMVEEFGSGRGAIGLAVALFLFVSAAGMFLAGRVADRIDSRTVLVAGLVVSGLGMACSGSPPRRGTSLRSTASSMRSAAASPRWRRSASW